MGIGKVLVGIILVIVGIWALVPYNWFGFGLGWGSQLIVVVMGLLPVFLIFIGGILVWIEAEEMKLAKPKRRRR